MYHLTILWMLIAGAAYVAGRMHGRSAQRRIGAGQ